MITKRTIVNQIEIHATGSVQVRMRKEIVEGDDVLSYEYHRTVIEPGVDPYAQFQAVNTHLLALGMQTVQVDDWKAVAEHCAVAHTAEVIDAFRKSRSKE